MSGKAARTVAPLTGEVLEELIANILYTFFGRDAFEAHLYNY